MMMMMAQRCKKERKEFMMIPIIKICGNDDGDDVAG